MRMSLFDNLDMSHLDVPKEELELLHRRSEEGSSFASIELSDILRDSIGENYKDASRYLALSEKYFKRAVEQGHPGALMDEALKYEEQDNIQYAIDYYSKADQKGVIAARIRLAYLKIKDDPLTAIDLLLTTRENDDPMYDFYIEDRRILLMPGENTYSPDELYRLFANHPPQIMVKIFQRLVKAGKKPQKYEEQKLCSP